jgi:hypothetical protein
LSTRPTYLTYLPYLPYLTHLTYLTHLPYLTYLSYLPYLPCPALPTGNARPNARPTSPSLRHLEIQSLLILMPGFERLR